MNSKGFTLLELLVTVAIIGILAAIATIKLRGYEATVFNSNAQYDLREGITAEEAYCLDNEKYVSCSNYRCQNILPGFKKTRGVVIFFQATGGGTGFTGVSYHGAGDLIYTYSSTSGGTTTSPRSGGSTTGGGGGSTTGGGGSSTTGSGGGSTTTGG